MDPKTLEDHLFNAAHIGDNEKIQSLLDLGADINSDNDHALRTAVTNNLTATVELLLKKGANPHVNDSFPLRTAAGHGNLKIVALLIQRGVYIHSGDRPAIQVAAAGGHTEVVRLLLSSSADLTVNSHAPLMSAAGKNFKETVELILSQKRYSDANPAETFHALCAIGKTAEAEKFLEGPYRNEKITETLDRALQWAAKNGHVDTITMLIRHEADVRHSRDIAIRYAAEHKQTATVKILASCYTLQELREIIKTDPYPTLVLEVRSIEHAATRKALRGTPEIEI